jgi:hypothetical protein
MYKIYKPLRNYVRTLDMVQSLGVIRAYLQNLQFGQPFPKDIEVHSSYFRSPRAAGVYEWELETLAKEIVLNSAFGAKVDLRTWDVLASAINKLKDLENQIGVHYADLFQKSVLLEIYRIAHRQFPRQHRHPGALIARYYKIFGTPELSAMIEARVGLNSKVLYIVGMSLMGVYLERFGLNLPARVDVPGVTESQAACFIDYFSSDVETMRKEIEGSQSYDQDFAYVLNPLRIHPRLRMELAGVETVVAPVPSFLMQRFTEGIYYEIYDAPGFSAAFGTSFEAYVGQVIAKGAELGPMSILPEATYIVGADEKRTVDWIVSDESADLFIECKTKRIRYAAKIALESTEILDEDLDKMAGFVVQIYKTLSDAKRGLYPHWKPSAKPIYPVVVTLEEWYAFGDRIVSEIDARIQRKLVDLGIATTLLESHPYTICNIAALERGIQIMAKSQIGNVMEAKTSGEQRRWEFYSLLLGRFGDSLRNSSKNLFPEALDELGAVRQ